jgi:hypothetical protein
MIDIHSKTPKQKCHIIVTTNTYKKGPICNDIKLFLKIYKGMKIIITKNLYPKLGHVNESSGYIENISLTNSK